MRCPEVREMLPAFVREGEMTLAMRRHLTRCDACSAELAQYETLLSSLSAMEAATVEPPRDLMPALLAIPSAGSRVEVVRTHLARNRRTYLGGAAVAVAGALAGAVVLRRRGGRLVTA